MYNIAPLPEISKGSFAMLDSTPARDPASGIRTGPDVRADPDVRAVPDVAVAASDSAHVHGGALHVSTHASKG